MKKLALVALCAAALLSACGGGSDVGLLPTNATLNIISPDSQDIAPTLRIAPVTVSDPDSSNYNQVIAPFAASPFTAAVVYSPSQIRSAYNLPVLPTGPSYTPAQLSSLGAGQTIYIVGAYHNPNAAAELALFNQKFNLPGCTTKVIPSTAMLPLPPPSSNSCDLSVVLAMPASVAMTSAVPTYNASWAMEMALDVQWSHATAPLARIVLIEAANSSLTAIYNAITLANAMGPGIVSMSFGVPEGSWTSAYDSSFAQPNMTYLAATGDSGAAVSWPAVSSRVVAVGGTTLSYDGIATRTEISWSGTGGGVSNYTSTPSFQNNLVPGLGTIAHRMVADVAFNADPFSGQYVAILVPGKTTPIWMSIGGTSLATPQWAGIMAIVNSSRVAVSKPVIGDPHTALYQQISTASATYSSVFADITLGTDGTCFTCAAKVGYDQLSGLGTPNVTNLVAALVTAPATVAPPPPAAPPIVDVITVTGKVGTVLSFTATATAANSVSFTMSGAPNGLVMSSTGAATWAAPLAGVYTTIVVAKDSVTGLSGQTTATVNISPSGTGPVITFTPWVGKVGTPMVGTFTVVDPGATSMAISINPGVSAIGFVAKNYTVTGTWKAPVAGKYNMVVFAQDNKKATTLVTIPITITK